MAKLNIFNNIVKDIQERQTILHYHNRPSVIDYGADKTGTQDSFQAFQEAINENGLVYVPVGSYYLSEPLLYKKSGDGLKGAGAGVTKLFFFSDGVKKDPLVSASIEHCHLSGVSIEPDSNALVVHTGENNQSYSESIGVDFTGIKESQIADISLKYWRKNFVLGYSVAQTYRNRIDGVVIWGGQIGIELGGSATGDGANANIFTGCSVSCSQVLLDVYGGLNSFAGIRLESFNHSVSGYPSSTIGIRLTAGYYAMGNNFTDIYMELGASGDTNFAIRVEDGNTGGAANITPNYFNGGYYSVNGLSSVNPYFYNSNLAIGYHLDAPGLRTRHLTYDIITGELVTKYYDQTGGTYTQKYDGTIITITAETYGTVAPTAGTWIKGARCWNTQPTLNGILLWICITAGTPGIWQAVSVVPAGLSHVRATKAATGVALTSGNKVDWDTETYDTLNEFNLTTNLFVASTSGYHLISAQADLYGSFTDPVNHYAYIGLYKNGVLVCQGGPDRYAASTGSRVRLSSFSTTVYLAQNDYINIRYFFAAEGAVSTQQGAAYNYLTIDRIF